MIIKQRTSKYWSLEFIILSCRWTSVLSMHSKTVAMIWILRYCLRLYSPVYTSVATPVGNHNRLSAGIGWFFRCDFIDYNGLQLFRLQYACLRMFHCLLCFIHITVMILSFRTDRSGQTVQTQIRLFLEEQSDQGLHCLPFCLHRLD